MNIRKTLYVINAALVLLLGFVVIKIAAPPQKVLSSAPVPTRPESANNGSQIPTPLPLNTRDFQNIIKNSLFAGPDSTSTPPASAPLMQDKNAQTSPLPKLKLELQGTITGPAKHARALIKDTTTGATDVYRIGNLVAGARLAGIEKNAVTLVHNGKNTILKINTSSSETDTAPSQPAELAQDSTPENNLPKISLTIKNQILEDIFNNARIEPFIADNQPQGLRISELEKAEKAKFLPLKNGDVIRLVNGQLLTNKQKAFQVIKKARSQPFLDVELLRDGAIKTLSFPPKSAKK